MWFLLDIIKAHKNKSIIAVHIIIIKCHHVFMLIYLKAKV
jgi:hypothetical protein